MAEWLTIKGARPSCVPAPLGPPSSHAPAVAIDDSRRRATLPRWLEEPTRLRFVASWGDQFNTLEKGGGSTYIGILPSPPTVISAHCPVAPHLFRVA